MKFMSSFPKAVTKAYNFLKITWKFCCKRKQIDHYA